MASGYVTFLLELLAEGDQVQVGSVAYEPQLEVRLPSAFVWQIIVDANALVVVRAQHERGVEAIAAARWTSTGLLFISQRHAHEPTGPQWHMVETAVRAQVAARPDLPAGPVHDIDLDEFTKTGTVEAVAARVRRFKRLPAPPGPVPSAEARGVRRRLLLGVVIMVVNVAIVAALVARCDRTAVAPTRSASPGPKRRAPPPPPSTPPRPRPVAERIALAPSLEAAIALARPEMGDGTAELGPGAELLARYASVKLRWQDVDAAAETTVGHVLKDPDAERGKRLCATGELLRIERRDLERRKIFVGQLRTLAGDAIAFVAVGSTGDLIKRSNGTFCGVAIGRSGDAVSMVGMFDLEENRRPIAEQ